MLTTTLSTQEVAALMGVTETSIKRWSNGGRLPCLKTPGGHRKFALKDVTAFAEANGYTITGTLPPPAGARGAEELEFAVSTRNYSRMSGSLLTVSLRGDQEGVYGLLLYLARHHISFATIADEVIRPALVKIGEKWKSGSLEVSQEHRASNAITSALIRLAPELHRKPSNGLSAACACPEGELHEIGLRSLASALETEGWNVAYIGANTPAGTLTAYLRDRKPKLLCCSTTNLKRGKQAEDLRSVGAACSRLGVHYVIGGASAEGHDARDFGCDYLATSVTDTIAHLRDAFGLRPGPKRHGAKVIG